MGTTTLSGILITFFAIGVAAEESVLTTCTAAIKRIGTGSVATIDYRPDGPNRGSILFEGDLQLLEFPQVARAADSLPSEDETKQMEDAARQIIQRLRRDLSVGDQVELRTTNITTTELGWTFVSLGGYLNGMVIDQSGVAVCFDQRGHLLRIDGTLQGCPPSMQAAVGAPHISEEQAIQEVMNWRKREGRADSPEAIRLARAAPKFISPHPPYVRWVISYDARSYTIDAQSGEVIDAVLNLDFLMAPTLPTG